MKTSSQSIMQRTTHREYTFVFHEDEARQIQQYLLETQRVSRTRLPDAVENLMYHLSRRKES